MFPYNIASSLVFALLSVYVIYDSASFPASESGSIGSGYWPALLGWLLLFLSLGLFLETMVHRIIARRRSRSDAAQDAQSETPSPFAFKSRGMVRVYLLCGAFLAFSVVMHCLNFSIASIVFVPLCMIILGEKRPLMVIAVTIGVPIVVYVIFEKVLGIPLPVGAYL